MVEVASARLPEARIVQGDAVPLPFADGELDRVFTGHFYGHLLARRAGGVRRRGPPGRERARGRRLRAARRVCEAEEWQERVLNDGTRHRVYKRYFTGAGLADELGGGDGAARRRAGSWWWRRNPSGEAGEGRGSTSCLSASPPTHGGRCGFVRLPVPAGRPAVASFHDRVQHWGLTPLLR